jgi:hypothetical protein
MSSPQRLGSGHQMFRQTQMDSEVEQWKPLDKVCRNAVTHILVSVISVRPNSHAGILNQTICCVARVAE